MHNLLVTHSLLGRRYRHLKHDNDYHDKMALYDFPLNAEDGGVRAPQLPGGACVADFPVVNLAAQELYAAHFGALLPQSADPLRGLPCVLER
jgi:DNA gyrase inhibitor GyrI